MPQGIRRACLEGLYQRLTQGAGIAAVLHLPRTFQEISALDSAILGFAAFVRQNVPASREREETLQALEELRSAIVKMMAPARQVLSGQLPPCNRAHAGELSICAVIWSVTRILARPALSAARIAGT